MERCKLGKAYGARFRILNPRGEGFGFVVAVTLFEEDSVDIRKQFFIRMEPVAHQDGKRHFKLAVRSHGEYVIYQMGGSFYLPFGTTERTEASFRTAKGNYLLFLTALTDKSETPVGWNPAL